MYKEAVDLSRIPAEGLKLERVVPASGWAIQEPDWQSLGDLEFQLSIKGGPRKALVKGKLSASIQANCHRCLKSTKLDLKRAFHLIYLAPDPDRFAREEVELTPNELEVSYLQGGILPIHELIREQIYLAVPMKVLCRADCRGLCPHCGADLNEVECGCPLEREDPRWVSLKNITSERK